MKNCPCCSNKSFSKCCEPYVTEKSHASTPESLMRSRYTAYSMGNIDYISETMKGQAEINFEPVEAKKWADSVKWLKLEVIEAPKISSDAEKGVVEFIAHYSVNGKAHKLHERSRFIKEDGRWYYVDGVHL